LLKKKGKNHFCLNKSSTWFRYLFKLDSMSHHHEQNREIDGLDQWIETNGPRLFLYARQQTMSYADAQDVYQEAVIATVRKALECDPPTLPALGSVFVAIKNKAIDLHRSHSSRMNRETQTVAMAETSSWFVEDIESKETYRLLNDVIRALPEDQQEVLLLKVWGGQTFQAIADMLGISANTVASRYRYALNQLKSTPNLSVV
jgi:RNA polymerase sigma-70 factor (ECF subfamily)